MKPEFALSLSAEGIVLLHRAAGGWRNVGSVAIDSDDLASELAALKDKGDRLASKGVCKLIIPNDQIRYLTIETGISDLESRHRLARAALEGATPYPVDELAFDLSEDGSQTHIAAVAYETLAEAESFALENGFSPASFVAIPGESGFLGEPFFGTAPSFGEAEVTPDGIAVVDIGPASLPRVEPEAKADIPSDQSASENNAAAPTKIEALPKAPATLEESSAETVAKETEAQDSGPIAGFSSRRRRPPGPTPAASPQIDKKRDKPAVEPLEKQTPKAAPKVAGAGTKPAQAKPIVGPGPKPAPSAQKAQSPQAKPLAAATTKAPSVTTAIDKPVGSPALPPAPPAGTAKAKSVSTAKRPAKGPIPGLEETPSSKGKPRFLGLILTAGLLLIMVAVAAFALLSDGGLFFSSERPPQEQSQGDPLADTSAPQTPDDPEIAVEPVGSGSTDTGGDATIPLSQVDPEPDSIAPQVSAIPSQADPGIVELGEEAETIETARLEPEAELDTSTGQPVLDALEGADPDQDPAEAALSEAALYAATGIWQQVPQIAEAPPLVSLDDIYIASIDNSDLSQDAVALPASPQPGSDASPDALSSPAAAGSDFELDNRGLVTATPEGTLNPDGIMIYLGRPSVVPPPTPARSTAEDAASEAENARLASLSRIRPRPRPSDLVEQAERILLGGLSRAELARVRPRARPASLKTEEQENQPVSDLAVTTSTKPRARPANFANLVDRATRQRATEAATPAAVATVPTPSVTPSIPSSASVARQATVKNAINLRRLNLIGVSGKPSNRQALVLLPSGRTRQVRVGDRLDGGTVVAISDSQLQYQKRGTNTTLRLPGN
jgi:hypothetical protein